MIQITKQILGSFEIFETTFKEIGDTQMVVVDTPVTMDEIDSVNFVIKGKFNFNDIYTYGICSQTYDYPERFKYAGRYMLTSMEPESIIICINSQPKGSNFTHAKRYLVAGEQIDVPVGHLLYLCSGSVVINDTEIIGPIALLAKTNIINITASTSCIASEIWV